MTRKQRRLALIGSAGGVLAIAAGLVLYALSDQIVFFRTPTDIAEKVVESGVRIRLGGLVADGSVERGTGTLVKFAVTDTEHTVGVVYEGVLPDLFREGQGVVTEGMLLQNGTFEADTVLAKHDENYMPKEVADALKDKGVWKGEGE
ncbi:MAG: cytochrome c maturation protein CcmE [Pseudomonadota bacterium]